MHKFELVIFDMDGLMFDTGRMMYRAYQSAGQAKDFEVSPDLYYYLTGRNDKDIRKELVSLYGEEAPTKEFRDMILTIKDELFNTEKRVGKKKGLIELIDYLNSIPIKKAICSGSALDTILFCLEVEDIQTQHFDIIVDGGQVTKSKPDPEVFLKACQKLHIDPSNTIVLEDSRAGVNAALAAGMTPYLVKDDLTDLPKITGKYKLKKDLRHINDYHIEGVKEFKDLTEVRNYLKTGL